MTQHQLLEVKAKIQIQRPADEIFEAITDPTKMAGYFIARGSGKIENGESIVWVFPESDTKVPVRGAETEPGRLVSFYWESEDGRELLVTITLESKGDKDTLVIITEKGMEADEAGIKWLKSNTEGWANFLACLKAYLEYGINLRQGAFDFMRR